MPAPQRTILFFTLLALLATGLAPVAEAQSPSPVCLILDQCGNGVCENNESPPSCPRDCGESRLVFVERTWIENKTDWGTPEDLGGPLRAPISALALNVEDLNANLDAVRVRQHIRVPELEQGSHSTRPLWVDLEIENRTNRVLEDVQLIAVLPDAIGSRYSIESDYPMTRKNTPVPTLYFNVPFLPPASRVHLTYQIVDVQADAELVNQLLPVIPAFFRFGSECPQNANTECTTNADCETNADACTFARCTQNKCVRFLQPNGTHCGIGAVCTNGRCEQTGQTTEPPAPVSSAGILIGAALLLLVGGLGYFAFLRK